MQRFLPLVLTTAGLTWLLAPGATAAGNLLVNGSFESGTNFGGDFIDLPGGSMAITGWTVGDHHIDYVKSATWNASHGTFSVDLDGSGFQQPLDGSISQAFATTVGQAYVVTFDISGNITGLPLIKQAEVSAGDNLQVYTFDAGAVVPYVPPLSIPYQHETFSFTALSTTTTLRFKSLTPLSGSQPGYGVVVDNVVVDVAPSAWTDLGFALAGVSGAPQLVGTGSLLEGSQGSLVLSGAANSAPAMLFLALDGTPTAFKCGTLVPVPVVTTIALLTNPSGVISATWSAWQPGLSGLAVHAQYAILDSAAICGVSLSNAVRGDVP